MLVDHHCHLDYPDFAADLDGVVARAKAAGVASLVTISTRIRKFDEIRAVAERYDDVWCSVGTHPHNADEERGILAEEIVRLSRHPKVVAIGEAGLDYHYKLGSPAAQAEGFRAHIAAARETGLPLEIHTRDADADTLALITDEHTTNGPFPAVLHCYTGGRELALRAVDLGLYVSFTGVITFKRTETLQEIAREIPAERLLVETDAPFLAPVPYRGKPNEPAYVVHTAAALARLRGVSEAEIAQTTTDNFFRLYSKAKRPPGAPPAGAGRAP